MTRKDFTVGLAMGAVCSYLGFIHLVRLVDRASIHVFNAEQTSYQQDLDSKMNWDKLMLATPLYQSDIKRYIPEKDWQIFRESLKGKTSQLKYVALEGWLQQQAYSWASCVQVTNYVNALKRGGLIE
jgi:hypothetical protein